MLLTIIDRKLKYFREELIEINTFEAKASQFNHFDGTYTKKTLSQRWNDFNENKSTKRYVFCFFNNEYSRQFKEF